MKTGEFCERCGIPPAHLRMLRTRGCLPFEEAREEGRHPNFSEADLRAMDIALSASRMGMPLQLACRLVRMDREAAARFVAALEGRDVDDGRRVRNQ